MTFVVPQRRKLAFAFAEITVVINNDVETQLVKNYRIFEGIDTVDGVSVADYGYFFAFALVVGVKNYLAAQLAVKSVQLERLLVPFAVVQVDVDMLGGDLLFAHFLDCVCDGLCCGF